MDWVVNEEQLELIAEAGDTLREFAGYLTWVVDMYDGDLRAGIIKATDKHCFEAYQEVGLVRGDMRNVEAHPNLLNAFRYVILSENISEINVINRDDAWDAMVEGIRLGTFN